VLTWSSDLGGASGALELYIEKGAGKILDPRMAAKVNYWARFIEAMRIKPAGYTDDPLLDLADFGTFEAEE
jgi:hypothetical protein